MEQLAYLALPYSGTSEKIAERVRLMTMYDAELMRNGLFTVSPVYKHLMLLNNTKMPGDWNYWEKYSTALLNRSTMLIVMCLPGWRESIGVQAEIEIAKNLNLPTYYVALIGEQSFTSLYPSISHLERVLFHKV